MADVHQTPVDISRRVASGGETGRAIAGMDWSATPLGPIADWPCSLATAVSMVLRSPVAMVLMWGPGGHLLYNDACAAIAGRRHPGCLGARVRDGWPELAGFDAHALRAGLAGESLSYRDRQWRVDAPADAATGPEGRSAHAWFSIDYSPVPDDSGAPAGVLAIVTETTRRVDVQSAHQEGSEQVFRSRQILDSAVDYAIVALDLDGRVTRWNEGAHRVLGWTEQEMLGRSAACFFTPEDRAAGRMEIEMQRAQTTGVGNDERWHQRKSGERFWASGEMTPILDEAGRAVGFVKVLRDRTEQHRAAEALKQSEERLNRAQEAGGVGTFSLQLEGNRLFGTRGFSKIFGLEERDGLTPEAVQALVIPEDAALSSNEDTRAAMTAPLDVEYRIRRANDGALRWIARKAEYEMDEHGRVVRLVGVVQDVTERKAAQAELDLNAAQFRTFAQTLPSHVWTSPADGRLDWFNDRVYEYSGVARGELDGHGWAQLVHADDLADAAARWSASLASGKPYETEFRVRRADGAYRWHLVRAVPLHNAEGAVSRWVGTNTDIHERKLHEAQIVRDRLRIWTLSQELMLVCDFEGRVSAVNPSATRLLGWEEAEMTGRMLADFIHPEDLEASAAELAKLHQGATTLAFENRYRTKEGGYRRMNWTAVPDGGRLHAVARDVTRERDAEEALRQSQKMEAVGQLTGGVAHDFNNLLTVIRTSVDLMRRQNVAEDRRQRFMESISNAVTRAAKLTGQLLAFARRQALQPKAFDAAENVQAISDMLSTLVGSRIAVDVAMPGHPCIVNADPSQFDTAIVNMAVNARDAMNGAGRLSIGVKALAGIPAVRSHPPVPGDVIAISLSDTGSGIPAHQIDRIFEPFFTTKDIGLGTGLGLSQVFGFAKQSGGEIEAESVVGEGTTFTLYLPRAKLPSEQAEASLEAAGADEGHGARILVVEDNVDVAASVEDTLSELGYLTQVVDSADAALAELAADASRFAAVFSDVVMAGMDGIQLGQEIRRRHEGLPIVLSSGYSHVLATDNAHGFVLLPKPYSLDAISRVMREALARRGGDAEPLPASEFAAGAAAPGIGPAAERVRLAELDSFHILDTEEEAAYDDLTRLASSFCDAPVALISLVDGQRQWFKSRVGLQARETPREEAFCAHAIQVPDQVMVVNDATRDERFFDNPLVTGNPKIRFYAGAPLVTSNGNALGTICVIDYEARQIDPKQLEMLQHLAAQVVKRLEARRLELTSRSDE